MTPQTLSAVTMAVAIFGLACQPAATAAQALQLAVTEYGISSAAARQMVTACLDLAASRGWKMQVAVVDRSGALVAFGRSDGASAASQDISLSKARTAARFGWSTEQFAQYAWPEGAPSPGPLAFVPEASGIAGGIPVYTAMGDLIGGVGVSGALPSNDRDCAMAAISDVGAYSRGK